MASPAQHVARLLASLLPVVESQVTCYMLNATRYMLHATCYKLLVASCELLLALSLLAVVVAALAAEADLFVLTNY